MLTSSSQIKLMVTLSLLLSATANSLSIQSDDGGKTYDNYNAVIITASILKSRKSRQLTLWLLSQSKAKKKKELTKEELVNLKEKAEDKPERSCEDARPYLMKG